MRIFKMSQPLFSQHRRMLGEGVEAGTCMHPPPHMTSRPPEGPAGEAPGGVPGSADFEIPASPRFPDFWQDQVVCGKDRGRRAPTDSISAKARGGGYIPVNKAKGLTGERVSRGMGIQLTDCNVGDALFKFHGKEAEANLVLAGPLVGGGADDGALFAGDRLEALPSIAQPT